MPTPDFDDVQYRIKAIDFDQQTYEGRKTMYLPQYFRTTIPLWSFAPNFKHRNHTTISKERRTMIIRKARG